MADNVQQLADHPKLILALVRSLTADLSKVDFSAKLNDLVQARKVSMRAIWSVLEEGEILSKYTKRQDNGLYLKMYDAVAGVHICIDLLIEPNNERIIVLWAEEDEEE